MSRGDTTMTSGYSTASRAPSRRLRARPSVSMTSKSTSATATMARRRASAGTPGSAALLPSPAFRRKELLRPYRSGGAIGYLQLTQDRAAGLWHGVLFARAGDVRLSQTGIRGVVRRGRCPPSRAADGGNATSLNADKPSRQRHVHTTVVDAAATPAPNLVDRDFTPEVNRRWAADITYIGAQEGRLYWATLRSQIRHAADGTVGRSLRHPIQVPRPARTTHAPALTICTPD